MKIEFIVGTLEQHQMELSFDHRRGDLRVLMDGTPVLQDMPRLARNSIKRYELNIGSGEKHMLALQLAYGDEPGIGDDPGIPATPRLSLVVSAITRGEVLPEALGLHVADSLFASNAAARA